MTAKELPGTVAPKKAAKKAAGKAAKKAAGKAAKKVAGKAAKKAAKKVEKAEKKAAKKAAKTPGHDLRRAYEHLHRLHVLAHSLSGEELSQVQTLSRFAGVAVLAEKPKTAADLLRAAEHFAFASLLGEADSAAPSAALVQTLQEEYEHLRGRAASDWEAQDPPPARAIRALYRDARSGAKAALKTGDFHRAMELVRAADALAHAAPGSLRVPAKEGKGSKLLS